MNSSTLKIKAYNNLFSAYKVIQFVVNVYHSFRCLHHTAVGYVADVPEEHTASIISFTSALIMESVHSSEMLAREPYYTQCKHQKKGST
jgi:hypothetical protein